MENVIRLQLIHDTYLIDIISPYNKRICVYMSKIKDEAEDTFSHLQDVLDLTPDNWLEHHKL